MTRPIAQRWGLSAVALVNMVVGRDRGAAHHNAFAKSLLQALSLEQRGGASVDAENCGLAVTRTMQSLESACGSAESASTTLRNACDHVTIYGDFGGTSSACQPLLGDLAAEFGGEKNYAAWCKQTTALLRLPAKARSDPITGQTAMGVDVASDRLSKVAEAKAAMRVIEQKRAKGEDVHNDIARLKGLLSEAERENQMENMQMPLDAQSTAWQQEPSWQDEEIPQAPVRRPMSKTYASVGQASPQDDAHGRERYVKERSDHDTFPVQDPQPARPPVPTDYAGSRSLPMRRTWNENRVYNARSGTREVDGRADAATQDADEEEDDEDEDEDGDQRQVGSRDQASAERLAQRGVMQMARLHQRQEQQQQQQQQSQEQEEISRQRLWEQQQQQQEKAAQREQEMYQQQHHHQQQQQQNVDQGDLRIGQASWGHKTAEEQEPQAAPGFPEAAEAAPPQVPHPSGAGGPVLPWGNVDAMAGGQEVMQRRPFGQEKRGTHLTRTSVDESNAMVDQIERAQAAEEKRASYRALTHLRGLMTSTYDSSANTHLQNIDEYNYKRKWRDNHPVRHLAEEEADVGRWAYPDGGEPDNQPDNQPVMGRWAYPNGSEPDNQPLSQQVAR